MLAMPILNEIKKNLDKLNDMAYEAGQIAMSYYHGERSLVVEKKADHSPVTSADLAAHSYLETSLLELFPHIPVISEESYQYGQEQNLKSDLFWLLDPIDGTKEFIKKTGEFTVNIALIQDQAPILGIIYAPLRGDLYYGALGIGCYKQDKEGVISQIHTRPMQDQFIRLLSRLPPEKMLQSYQEKWPKADIALVSSSLKLCLLAEGTADVYVCNHPTNEWDTAAGQCILESAGGRVYSLEGQRLTYRKLNLLNSSFMAFGDADIDYSSYL